MSFSKKIPIAFTVVLLVLSICFSTLSAEETAKDTSTETVRKVSTATLKSGSFTLPFTTTGQLQPISEVWISPEISGVVQEVYVDIGSRVEKNDKIMKFSDTYSKLRVDQARAAVQVAKSQLEDTKAGTRPEDIEAAQLSVKAAEIVLEKAERDFIRAKDLFERGSLSQTDFDNATTGLESARIQLSGAKNQLLKAQNGATATQVSILDQALAQAEQALQTAEQNLKDCIVRAPFSGIITEKAIAAGSFSGQGDPHIRLLDDRNLRMTIGIPERYAIAVKAGLKVNLYFNGTMIKSKIDLVLPRINPSNRTITCYVNIDNKEYNLPALLFGEARIDLEVTGHVVPTTAIVYRGEQTFICTVNAQDQAHFIEVKPGISSGAFINISGEIKDGQEYVIEEASDISEGQPLQRFENTPR